MSVKLMKHRLSNIQGSNFWHNISFRFGKFDKDRVTLEIALKYCVMMSKYYVVLWFQD